MFRLSVWSASVLALTAQLVSAQITIDTPASISSISSGLSEVLGSSWIGMGIEPSNVQAFLGSNSANEFSIQLFENLGKYTGKPPHIRIGGNTDDVAIYNASYQGWGYGYNHNSQGETSTYQFGPRFFQTVNYLPKGTPITYNIGLAYNGSDAVNMSVAIATELLQKFTNVNISSFEVGNEPDLYIENSYRPSTWTDSDYGDEWLARVEAIYTQVLQPNGYAMDFFEGACTATTAAYPSYRISNLVGTSLATDSGEYLAGWNQHDYYYYVDVSDYQLTLEKLMNLAATYSQFSEWKSQASQAAVTGKPYYLREMGAVGPNGIQGISDTFGAALWTLNFFLYVSTIGVDSVQIHMLQDSYGAPWQPIDNSTGVGMFVRPSYYAYTAMAQITGAGCGTQIASLDIDGASSSYTDNLAAYGAYLYGALQSVVIINSYMVNSTQSDLGSQQVQFDVGTNLAGKTFYLSVLTAAGAEVTQNVTWNGLNYEQSGSGAATNVSSGYTTVTVDTNGSLIFDVRNSQAIVANLGSILGTANNVVNETACSTSSSSSSTTTGTFSTAAFSSGLSTYAIAGIAAGGGVFLLLLLGLTICLCRRRIKRRNQQKRIAQYGDKAALLSDASAIPPAGAVVADKAGYAYRKGGMNGYIAGKNMGSHEDISMWAVGQRGQKPEWRMSGKELDTSLNSSALGTPITNRNSNPWSGIDSPGYASPGFASPGFASPVIASSPQLAQGPNGYSRLAIPQSYGNSAESRNPYGSVGLYSHASYGQHSQQNLAGNRAAPPQTMRDGPAKSRSWGNFRQPPPAGPQGDGFRLQRHSQPVPAQGSVERSAAYSGMLAAPNADRSTRPQSEIGHGSSPQRGSGRAYPASAVGHGAPARPQSEIPIKPGRTSEVGSRGPGERSRSQPRTPSRTASAFTGSMYQDQQDGPRNSYYDQPSTAAQQWQQLAAQQWQSLSQPPSQGVAQSQSQPLVQARHSDTRLRQAFEGSTPTPERVPKRMRRQGPTSSASEIHGSSRDPLAAYYRAAANSEDHIAYRDPNSH